MSRQALKVDKKTFEELIQKLESENQFSNLFALQSAAANTEYCRNIGMSVASVYNYIKKFNIVTKTKAGKRGAGLKKMHEAGTTRMSRAEKWKDNPESQDWLKEVRNDIEGYCKDIGTDGKPVVDKNKLSRFRKIIDKAENGSVKSLVALQCISCCAGQTSEIRDCQLRQCSLWGIRPWKSGDNEFSDIEVDDIPQEQQNG